MNRRISWVRQVLYVLTSEMLNSSLKVLVGMDTRISGEAVKIQLLKGSSLFYGGGCCISLVWYHSAVAYLVRNYKADAGVVISASLTTLMNLME